MNIIAVGDKADGCRENGFAVLLPKVAASTLLSWKPFTNPQIRFWGGALCLGGLLVVCNDRLISVPGKGSVKSEAD